MSDPALEQGLGTQGPAVSPNPPADIRYARNPSPHGTHELVLRSVPTGSRVLDVGCAGGYLGETLVARGCRVWGLDADPVALGQIPDCYEDVRLLDLEETGELPWPERSFDVVVAADVLEHLRDPARTLGMLRRCLRPGGLAMVSLPNVAHLSVRLPLLFGRFRYKETGILDQGHLQLFTFETARELAERAGFRVEAVLAGSDHFGALMNGFPALGRFLRGLLASGIVLLLRPATDSPPPWTAPVSSTGQALPPAAPPTTSARRPAKERTPPPLPTRVACGARGLRMALPVGRGPLVAVGAGIALRLLLSMIAGHPYDFEIWRTYVKLVWGFHANALFWWSQGPLGLISLVAAQSPAVLVEGLGGRVPVAIENLLLHLPFLGGDLLLAFALWRLAGRLAPDWAGRVLGAWALLPGIWWIPAGHGQFDPWIPASILLAMVAASEKRWSRAGAWLGLGFGFKYVPVVLLPGFLLVSWRRGRGRGARQLLEGFSLVAVISTAPLVVTAFSLGLTDGIALLWDRVGWWSVGSGAVLSDSLLARAVSSPYPLILGLVQAAGASPRLVERIPPWLVGGGLLAVLSWFCWRLRRSTGRGGGERIEPLLVYACLTLLVVGGLSQVAVIQRLYWAAPLLIGLAVVRRAPLTFGLACLYSYLFVLPEWLSTNPFLYLRPPLTETGLRLAAASGAITGLGQSHGVALLLGGMLVPVGFLAVVWKGGAARTTRVSRVRLTVLVAGAMGLVVWGVTAGQPAVLTVVVPLTLLVLATGCPRVRGQPTNALLAVVVGVGLVLAAGADWARWLASVSWSGS